MRLCCVALPAGWRVIEFQVFLFTQSACLLVCLSIIFSVFFPCPSLYVSSSLFALFVNFFPLCLLFIYSFVFFCLSLQHACISVYHYPIFLVICASALIHMLFILYMSLLYHCLLISCICYLSFFFNLYPYLSHLLNFSFIYPYLHMFWFLIAIQDNIYSLDFFFLVICLPAYLPVSQSVNQTVGQFVSLFRVSRFVLYYSKFAFSRYLTLLSFY